MVQVILRIVTHPDSAKEMIHTLRSLMLPLQAAAGFIACRLYVDTECPEELCYVEEWQTSGQLDQQIRSSHYTRLLALMEEAAEPPGLQLNWVTAVKGLDYLEAVRLANR